MSEQISEKEYLVRLEFENGHVDERLNSPAKLICVLCAFIEQLAEQKRITPARVVIEEFDERENK